MSTPAWGLASPRSSKADGLAPVVAGCTTVWRGALRMWMGDLGALCNRLVRGSHDVSLSLPPAASRSPVCESTVRRSLGAGWPVDRSTTMKGRTVQFLHRTGSASRSSACHRRGRVTALPGVLSFRRRGGPAVDARIAHRGRRDLVVGRGARGLRGHRRRVPSRGATRGGNRRRPHRVRSHTAGAARPSWERPRLTVTTLRTASSYPPPRRPAGTARRS